MEVGAVIAPDTKRWPSLVRPAWITLTLTFLTAEICPLLVIFTQLPFIITLIAAIITGCISAYLTLPLKRKLPPRFRRVSDLVQFVTTLDTGTWLKDEVFQKVKAITIDQLGVKESKVTMEARFIDDLGVD